jgi:malate dehydrogenase (oxaloacetate-decarboxylating)(NADP+)
MKPIFDRRPRRQGKRVIFAEGEDERVLRAAQVLLEDASATADPHRSPAVHRAAARSASACRIKPRHATSS